MTRVIRREIQFAPAGSRNSATPFEPTPSPQRTGAPTARSRSRTSTSSPESAAHASRAATSPAGPPPTTRMSQRSSLTLMPSASRGGERRGEERVGDHQQRADGAGGDALPAAGAGLGEDD